MRPLIPIFTVLFLVTQANGQDRIITTGVPFLLITSDARAAGMGDLGVATSSDNYSQYWNPAKYVFSRKKKGIGLSYTPYLSKLVDDIFLGNIKSKTKRVANTQKCLRVSGKHNDMDTTDGQF